MGQTPSQDKMTQHYHIIQKRDDGSILLKHKTSHEEYLLRNFVSNMEDQINGLLNLLKKRRLIKNQHILDLVQVIKKQQKQGCSSLSKMHILIEYPFKNLFDQITERKVKRQYFIEDELWSILYSCCVGMNAIYTNKISHEALDSKQIYINKNGIIQLSDPLLLGLQKNYIKLLKKNNDYAHVSPQIMNFLDDCNFSYYDKDKSDIFVLGTIMIEASLLKPIRFYDKNFKKPKLDQISKLLNQIRKMYSQNFSKVLSSMVEVHCKMRPNFTQVIKKIQNQNSIDEKTLKNQVKQANHQSLQFIPKLTFKKQNSLKDSIQNNNFQISYPLNNSKFFLSQKNHKNNLSEEDFKMNINTQKKIQQKIQSPLVNLSKKIPQKFHQPPVVSSGRQQVISLQNTQICPSKFIIQPLNSSNNPVRAKLQNSYPTIQKKTSHNALSTFKQTRLTEELLQSEPIFVCQILENGQRYEGYKKNRFKNGRGILYFKDGGCYNGNWKMDKMDGKGTLYFQNGQIAYEGQWQDDQFSGKGRVFNDKPQPFLNPFNFADFARLGDKWIYYEGDFKNDSKHGRGKVQLTNGQIFEGRFVNDAIEGEGIFYCMNKKPIQGMWKDNMLVI